MTEPFKLDFCSFTASRLDKIESINFEDYNFRIALKAWFSVFCYISTHLVIGLIIQSGIIMTSFPYCQAIAEAKCSSMTLLNIFKSLATIM